MLTAIRSFAADAFEASEDDGLDAFQVGELSVVVEASQDLTLAAVVRGRLPRFLRESLEDSVQHFQLQFSDELQNFDGETGPFVRASERMRQSLAAKLKEAPESPPRRGRFLLVAGALLALGLISFWLWNVYQTRRADDRLVDALHETPGIVVTEVERRPSSLTVAGLRDSYAATPEEVLARVGSGKKSVTFQFEGYSSHDPDLVLARARSQLSPPPSVELRLVRENVLQATLGDSSAGAREWLESAERLWPSVVGVRGFEAAGAAMVERQVQWIEVPFALGSSELESASLSAVEQLRSALIESYGSVSAKISVWGIDGGQPAEIDPQLLSERLATLKDALGKDAGLLGKAEIGGVVGGSLECEEPCDLVAGLRFSLRVD